MSKTNIVVLEETTPYDQSIKWTIHNNYFQKKGSEAWMSSDVPYYVTCNMSAARQNAVLVHEAVKRMEEEGSLGEKDSINILETASGLGFFALNFIQAFQDIDAQNGTDYCSRLKYFFSDYSEKNLRDASTNGCLQERKKKGVLDFYIVDALLPQEMRPLDADELPEVPQFVAVIANYMHCCLPLTIVRKSDGEFRGKHIRLSLTLKPGVQDTESYIKEAIEDPTKDKITENLTEEVSWKEIDGDFFRDPLHEEVMEEAVEEFPVATAIYPYGSFQCIENTLPLLHEGGIIVISDKGYASKYYMRGERTCEPSIHGNSFAHSVNFPVLEILAQKLGLGVSRTDDPDLSIQTILIEKRAEPALKDVFNEQFIEENANVDASDFYKVGRQCERDGEYETAARFYLRANKARPSDAQLCYRLGNCYYKLEEYNDALSFLQTGLAYDFFTEFDFDFQMGLAFHNLGDYEQAIVHYDRSLEKDQSEVTHYDIGLCKEHQGRLKEAHKHYAQALDINPNYERAQAALESLSRA